MKLIGMIFVVFAVVAIDRILGLNEFTQSIGASLAVGTYIILSSEVK